MRCPRTPILRISIEISQGTIAIKLVRDKAPKSVENFLAYVKAGFYDGTIFHRVIPDFMIQGGGFTPDMSHKPLREPIAHEADKGVTNDRGTLAMARTSDPNSAPAQFFINLVVNQCFNHTAKDASGWGYTVFGMVTAGRAVVDKIAAVATGNAEGRDDVLVEPVEI